MSSLQTATQSLQGKAFLLLVKSVQKPVLRYHSRKMTCTWIMYMLHGHARGHAAWKNSITCSLDVNLHTPWAGSKDMQHAIQQGNAVWTCSMDMQLWHAAWTCGIDIDMRYEHAAWTNVQHGNAEWTWIMNMKHGPSARTCSMGTQHGHAAWHAAGTYSLDKKHAHAAWTRNMDMKHGHAAWTWSTEIQNGHGACTSSKEKQLRHAAWACIRLTQDPCFSFFRVDLGSGTRFPVRMRVFSFALGAFHFFALVFLHAPALVFSLRAREREKAIKARTSTSGKKRN